MQTKENRTNLYSSTYWSVRFLLTFLWEFRMGMLPPSKCHYHLLGRLAQERILLRYMKFWRRLDTRMMRELQMRLANSSINLIFQDNRLWRLRFILIRNSLFILRDVKLDRTSLSFFLSMPVKFTTPVILHPNDEDFDGCTICLLTRYIVVGWSHLIFRGIIPPCLSNWKYVLEVGVLRCSSVENLVCLAAFFPNVDKPNTGDTQF